MYSNTKKENRKGWFSNIQKGKIFDSLKQTFFLLILYFFQEQKLTKVKLK